MPAPLAPAPDELRLAAVAVRRHDHPPRDGIGDRGAVLLAHEVQARVDPGRGPRARDNLSVSHVEDVRIDLDTRVASGERRCVDPVRRRPASVEQTCGGQDERTAADTKDPAAASHDVAQRLEQGRRRQLVHRPPGSDLAEVSAMVGLVVVMLLLMVGSALGLSWGADSRDGQDWQQHRLRGQRRPEPAGPQDLR